jgi:hypothetical protein
MLAFLAKVKVHFQTACKYLVERVSVRDLYAIVTLIYGLSWLHKPEDIKLLCLSLTYAAIARNCH